jgi:hypothetical protein
MSLPNGKRLIIYWLLLKMTLTTVNIFSVLLSLHGVVMQEEIPVPCEYGYRRRGAGWSSSIAGLIRYENTCVPKTYFNTEPRN